MAGGHSLNIKQGPGPRDPRHPSRIRAGQIFFPRTGRRRRRLTVKAVEGEWVRVRLDDKSERRLSLDALLEVNEAGTGTRYRFQGWKPRPRGYRTEIEVVAIDADRGRCRLVLPEWDPATEVEEILPGLPASMRVVGSIGSCMANLASPSAAGLGVHSCRATKVRGISRAALAIHPDILTEGQKFRRLVDGCTFRILEAERRSTTVVAWTGRRRVRLSRTSLLACRENGQGRDYEYLGGGVKEARRRRQAGR